MRKPLTVKPFRNTWRLVDANGYCVVTFAHNYRIEAEGLARAFNAHDGLVALAQGFVDAWGKAVADDEDINGGDAVEFIGGFVSECENALKLARGDV